MLSKNLNRPRRKPGAITVAVLSLLLGAQVAALADLQYDYDYGFNRSQDAIRAIGGKITEVADVTYVIGYYQGFCGGKFGPSTSDVLACENGGLVALNQAEVKSGYHGQ